MIRIAALLAFSVFIAGCDGTESSSVTEDNSGSVVTPEPIEIEPPVEPLFRLMPQVQFPGNNITDVEESSDIRRIVRTLNGDYLALGHFRPSLEKYEWKGFLARIGSDSQIKQMKVSADSFMDLCIHPSGDYSLAQLRKVDDRYQVWLSRHQQDGRLITEVALTNGYAENQYEVMTKTQWQQEGHHIESFNKRLPDPNYPVTYFDFVTYFGFSVFNLVRLTCQAENLVVAFNHEGPMVSRYDSLLQKQWSQPASIHEVDNSLILDSTFFSVAVDDDGLVYSVAELQQGSIPNFNHRFNRQLSFDMDNAYRADLLVRKYSPTGEVLAEKIIGSDYSDVVRGAMFHNGRLYVATASRLDKGIGGNQDLEWDAGVLTVDPSNLAAEYKKLDINQEDMPAGLLSADGHLYLYGVTGYQQANTNSVVSFGHGFYKELLTDTDDKTYHKIAGMRHTLIRDLSVFQGQVVAVGETDAPITHSEDRHSHALFYTAQ